MVDVIEGWDAHKAFCVAVRLARDGAVLEKRRIPTRLKALEAEATRLAGEDVPVYLEASTISEYIASVLSRLGVRVVIGDSGTIAARRRRGDKDDDGDARHLAELARMNAFPAIYRPGEWARKAQDVCRYRHRQGETMSQVKNRIHAMLTSEGLSERVQEPFSRAGLAQLRRLLRKGTLSTETAVVLSSELALLAHLNTQMKELDLHIARLGAQRPEVQLLMSIRGCDVQLATTIISEIDTIGRFETPDRLVSYAGLRPWRCESGGKARRSGRISKAGPDALRWALTMVAHAAHTLEERVGKLWEHHYAKKKAAKFATTNVARKMAVWIWHMLRKGESFRHSAADQTKAFDAVNRKVRRMKARAKRAAPPNAASLRRTFDALMSPASENPTERASQRTGGEEPAAG